MRAPRLTDRVRRGLWIIVARSATVWSHEQLAPHEVRKDEREEHEAILAAVRYAEHHFKEESNAVASE